MVADRVLLRMVRSITDAREGVATWVVETDYVRGLVAGGYAVIDDRKEVLPKRARKADQGGEDQAESA
jgi:N-acetylmuramic acid 6-phosphate (MurNAc-6-P) etherase